MKPGDETPTLMFIIGVVVGVLLTVILSVHKANAQDHQHPPEDVELHEKFYSTWLQPNPNATQRITSCCDKKDCFPAEVRRRGDQWEFLSKFSHQWTPIRADLLEHNQPDPRESPDGRPHVCQNPNNLQVLCATLGSGT